MSSLRHSRQSLTVKATLSNQTELKYNEYAQPQIDDPIIIRPHIVFTDGRQRQPNITRPHIVFTDGRQQRPNHNTTTFCVY